MSQNQTEPDYRKPQNWVNFGDINPKLHGGLWVRWENGLWHIIETRHPEDLPEDFAKGEFYFRHYYIEEMDIWENGEPGNGFTEWAREELESMANKPFHLIEPRELPEDETVNSYMNWIIEEFGEYLIGTLAYSTTHYYHPSNEEFAGNYWAYLDRFGIDEDMA